MYQHQLLHPRVTCRVDEIGRRDTRTGRGEVPGEAAPTTAPSSGSGSIVSWMVVEPALNEVDAEPMPTTIAIVDLDSGGRIYASIEGEVLVRTGQRVRVLLHPAIRGARFPLRGVVGSIACDCRRERAQTHEPPPRHQHTHNAGDILEWFLRRRSWTTWARTTEVGRSR
ncbi:OB-fold domain-containing protein [Rhodococcus oryzae]|uniref:OB-fold domain-containing protein n=1 Tax=Rhodococcus oryzae TaxID=2571143 RepID=A0ABY2RLH1_9NOCA|nr:OB-fold domain-containing protein [Rhodococcus oryzae]TJZ78511.1 OB-fold domain-containing protein [Rhodococcus oryzae]